jgi:hypothetical protein
MPPVDYKSKYQELKAHFMSAIDVAWRDGYENGMQGAQMDQAQQAQAQADAAAQQPGQPGQEGEATPQPGEEPEGQSPISQNPNGDDELGQHIEKLESMLGKSEISSFELQDLKKTLNDIRSLQVSINLSKSMATIKNSKLAKSHSFSLTPKVVANLPEQSKKALSMQESIVSDIFKKWDSDQSKAASDISSILSVEGLTKKE